MGYSILSLNVLQNTINLHDFTYNILIRIINLWKEDWKTKNIFS